MELTKKVPTTDKSQENNHLLRMLDLSLIHIPEPTRKAENSYAVFCLKKKTRPSVRSLVQAAV